MNFSAEPKSLLLDKAKMILQAKPSINERTQIHTQGEDSERKIQYFIY